MAAPLAVGGGWEGTDGYWSGADANTNAYVFTTEAAPKLALVISVALVLLWAWHAYRRTTPPER